MNGDTNGQNYGEPCFASPSAAPPGGGAIPQAATPREAWRSDELLGDRSEVLILHNNEVYRLRRTRQGKLILHK